MCNSSRGGWVFLCLATLTFHSNCADNEMEQPPEVQAEESQDSDILRKEPLTLYDKMYKNMPWAFIQKKLSDDASELGFSTWGTIIKWGATLAAIIPGCFFANRALQDNDGNFSTENLNPLEIIETSVLLFGAPTVIHFLTKYLIDEPLKLQDGSCKAFQRFIVNWEEYKKYTPQELHPFFNDVFEGFNTTENKVAFLQSVAPETMQQIARLLKEKQSQTNINEDRIAWRNILGPPILLGCAYLSLACLKVTEETLARRP